MDLTRVAPALALALWVPSMGVAQTAASGGPEVTFMPPQLRVGVGNRVTFQVHLDGGQTLTVVDVSTTSPTGLFTFDVLYSDGGTTGLVPWRDTVQIVYVGGTLSPPIYFGDTNPGASAALMAVIGDGGVAPTSASVTVDRLTVQDDFESRDFSQWESASSSGAVWFDAGSVAAHRGDSGVRVTDYDSTPPAGAADPAVASILFPSGPGVSGFITGPYYSRAWVRVVQSNDAGHPQLFRNGKVALAFDPVSLQLSLRDGSGAQNTIDALRPNAWSLIELAMLPGEAGNGTLELWVDGKASGAFDGFDFFDGGVPVNEGTASSIQFGELADPGPWQGVIDFDDYRAGVDPPASRLVVDTPRPASSAGSCTQVVVRLLDPYGAPANAPYDVEASLANAKGPGAFYSDPACAHAASSVTIAAGTPDTLAYFQGTTDLSGLTASHPDFLGAPPLPKVDLQGNLGCGCLEAGPDPWAVLLLLLPVFGRRRSARD